MKLKSLVFLVTHFFLSACVLTDVVAPYQSNQNTSPYQSTLPYPGVKETPYVQKRERPNEYRAVIKEAQLLLNKLGYSVGRPDGIAGKMTREGIASFQRDFGLPVTGVYSKEILKLLKGEVSQFERESADNDNLAKGKNPAVNLDTLEDSAVNLDELDSAPAVNLDEL